MTWFIDTHIFHIVYKAIKLPTQPASRLVADGPAPLWCKKKSAIYMISNQGIPQK